MWWRYQMMNNWRLILVVMASLNLAMGLPASAQAPAEPSFSLTPAKRELLLAPGQSSTVTFYLDNNLGREATFTIGVEDIAPAAGTAVQLLGASTSPYSLKPFLSLPAREFSVPAGGRHALVIGVDVPLDWPPSGQYAAITVGIEPATGGGETKVSTRLGALLFVKVAAGGEASGALTRFGVIGGWWQVFKPKTVFHFSVKNDGRTYLNPYGAIILNKKLGWGPEGSLRVEPNFVLPGSTRLREVELRDRRLCGWYQAELALNLGFNNQVERRVAPLLICSMLQLPSWWR